MPDISAPVAAMAELAIPLIRSLLRTTLGMIVLALLLAFAAYKIVDPLHSPTRTLLAVGVVLILGAVLGGILALKRAILTALRYGVARLKLGQRTVGALFTRISSLPGAQSVRIVPLAQAEELLRRAVAGLYKEGGVSGFLRVRLHQALVERIEAITLTRFRAEGEKAGGIDLAKVGDELVVRADEILIGIFDGAMTKITVLFILALGISSLLSALIIRHAFPS